MGRKNYDEEFKRRAVDLYESTPGATATGIASDLGVGASTLWKWIGQYGTGTKTPAIGRMKLPTAHETTAAKIARLELENLQLRADHKRLETEKEILRAAAKYFAGETNW